MTTVPPQASFEPSASRVRDGWIVLAVSAAVSAAGVATLLIRRPKPACEPMGVPA